jgi:thermitase
LHLVVTSAAGALEHLARQPGVEFVEPNRIRRTTLYVPNDPSYGSQWALQTIQAPQAWNLLPGTYLTASSAGSQRTHVAVIDTGLDCTHPDFANAGGGSLDSAQGGQINFALSQAYVATTVPNPCAAWADDYGHGTGTAGIIGASASNGIGIAGAAYPVDLVIYKVTNSSGQADDATIANAIMTAANAGIHVISISMGGNGYAQSLQTAINYAWARDTIVVASAGNNGSSSLFFPADADQAIGVSATDSTNFLAGFSNYGSYIAIGAPGSNVLTTFPQYPTPIGATNYAGFTGTSAAAPQVSSVAAMLVMSTPNTSAAAITQRLQQTASSAGYWNQSTGYGVVNAFNAVAGNLQPSSLGGIRGQVTNNYGIPAGTAQVNINGNVATLDSTGLYHFANLPAGDYTITVSLSGYPAQSVTATVAPGADTEMQIVVGANYGRFSGSVTDGNGAAVTGAIVQAMSNGIVTATAVANQSGQYALWVPAGGTYNLRTTQIGRQTSIVYGVGVGSGGNTGVNLTLPKLPAISGTVVNANSQGVANAQLFITGGGTNAGATADGNGNFSTIGLPAGNYSVTATANGQPNTTLNLSILNPLQGLIIRMGGTTAPPPPPISISINPGSASLNQGGAAQFTASVQNASNTGVVWSLSPAVGSVNANGFYQAPWNISQNQNITISATSIQDYTKSASATIYLIAPPPPPPPPPTPPVTVTSVSVSPAAIMVLQGNQQQFTATVNGSVSSAVTWTISPPLGTITSNGLYSAPANVPSMQIVSVKAASTANPAKSSTTILFLAP